MWVLVLQAAEEWGCAPWVIEAEATAVWWQRWVCWKEEKARLASRDSRRSGKGDRMVIDA